MKYQKLFLSAALGCLLVGGSGAAMAVDCAGGRIVYTTVPEIVIDGQPCFIQEVIVEGSVQITNSPELSMFDVDVGGPVTVTGGNSNNIVRTDVLIGNLGVTGSLATIVAGNTVQAGDLVVNNNTAAVVQRNAVNGNIQCVGNTELDALGNRATGTVDCVRQ